MCMYLYICLVNHNAIVTFLLGHYYSIVWSHLCESCYPFSLPCFNKMSNKYGFATGRTAMSFLIWHFLVSIGAKPIVYQNNWSLRRFPTMTTKNVFFSFAGTYVYIYYIYIHTLLRCWEFISSYANMIPYQVSSSNIDCPLSDFSITKIPCLGLPFGNFT